MCSTHQSRLSRAVIGMVLVISWIGVGGCEYTTNPTLFPDAENKPLQVNPATPDTIAPATPDTIIPDTKTSGQVADLPSTSDKGLEINPPGPAGGDDTTAPTVATVSYDNQPPNSSIIGVTFSEPVQVTPYPNCLTLSTGKAFTKVSVAPDQKKATFRFDGLFFNPGDKYGVTLSRTCVKDTAGNPMTSDVPWSINVPADSGGAPAVANLYLAAGTNKSFSSPPMMNSMPGADKATDCAMSCGGRIAIGVDWGPTDAYSIEGMGAAALICSAPKVDEGAFTAPEWQSTTTCGTENGTVSVNYPSSLMSIPPGHAAIGVQVGIRTYTTSAAMCVKIISAPVDLKAGGTPGSPIVDKTKKVSSDCAGHNTFADNASSVPWLWTNELLCDPDSVMTGLVTKIVPGGTYSGKSLLGKIYSIEGIQCNPVIASF